MGNEENGISEVLDRSVMSLCEGAMSKVREDSELSEDFEVDVWMHQGFVSSSFLLAFFVDVVTELAWEGVLSELLYADDWVLIRETFEKLRIELENGRRLWVQEFWTEPWKDKMLVTAGISKDGLSKSKVDPCGICNSRVMAN